MAARPKVNIYHCICTTLLLGTTHDLTVLPRRTTNTGGLDKAIILPLSPLPSSSPSSSPQPQSSSLPPEGHTLLLGLTADKKISLFRREDGFEKRVLYRCSRCRLVVAYELVSGQSESMDIDVDVGVGGLKNGEERVYRGKILYVLPAGLVTTEAMAKGRKIAEEEVGIGSATVAVFE